MKLSSNHLKPDSLREETDDDMSALGWILLFFLMQPDHSETGAPFLPVVVREADDAVLACPHTVHDPQTCHDPVWTRNDSLDPLTTSERRTITASCSLLIKDVNVLDSGVYGCTTSQRNQTQIVLSVVSMVECKSQRFVTVECSVSGALLFQVEWQGFEGETGVVAKRSPHFASVSFSTAHPVHAARTYEFWRCHVKDINTTREHIFTYNPKYPEKSTTATATSQADHTLDWLMVALRVAELLLLVFITVLLFRSREKRSSLADQAVDTSARFTNAANQVKD